MQKTKLLQKEARYPNLSTIIMVEHALKKHSDIPMTLAELKKKLPKQVMHQTLRIILNYLYASGKIIYGPKGFQWVFIEPENLKSLLEDSIEI